MPRKIAPELETITRPPPSEQRAAIVLVKSAAMEIRSGGCKGFQWDVMSSRGEHFTVTVRLARSSRRLERAGGGAK